MALPTRAKYVAFVLAQVGVKETPLGSNITIFGKAYGWIRVAWCQIFDWYCAWKMGMPHLKTASTMAAVAAARKNGSWRDGIKGIQPGDSVYFHWSNSPRAKNQPDHVESCIYPITGGVNTVGGNVGNRVSRQNRRANILGYIPHPFAPDAKPAPKPKPATATRKYPGHVVRKGMHGADVVWIQKRLVHHKLKVAVDGDYGKLTAAAVHVFRAKQGTGAWRLGSSVGAETWKRLGR